jgi:MYXO-CTERM domain-containing protein
VALGQRLLTQGNNLYYDATESANAYLGGLDYRLAGGGSLKALSSGGWTPSPVPPLPVIPPLPIGVIPIPVPEPGPWALWLAGIGALVGLARRRGGKAGFAGQAGL